MATARRRYVVLEEIGDEEEEVLHGELVEGSLHDGRHALQHEENIGDHVELLLGLHLRAEELHQDQRVPHRASGGLLGETEGLRRTMVPKSRISSKWRIRTSTMTALYWV